MNAFTYQMACWQVTHTHTWGIWQSAYLFTSGLSSELLTTMYYLVVERRISEIFFFPPLQLFSIFCYWIAVVVSDIATLLCVPLTYKYKNLFLLFRLDSHFKVLFCWRILHTSVEHFWDGRRIYTHAYNNKP